MWRKFTIRSAVLKRFNTNLFKTFYLPKAIDAETLKLNNRDIKQQLASLRFYDLLNIDEFMQSAIVKKSLLQQPNSMQEQIIYNYPLWSIRELIFNAI